MTPRTPGSKTLGPRVAKLATALGRPPKRWQRLMYDLFLELDDSGRRRYHTCLLSIQRQAGKTTGTNQIGMHRTLIQPDARVWYTAQTGQAARKRWIEETANPASLALGSLVKIKFGAGDTGLIVPATGSQFRPMPPTPDYLHGEQSDLVIIDESWAHTEPAGAQLLQAVVPTQNTRKDLSIGPQIIYASTRGTAASTWWHERLDRAIAEQPPGVAIIDYGIGPDVDPTDLEAVAACHPAYGEGLTMDGLREAASELSPAEFARGYGNIATGHRASIFDPATIADAETTDPLDPGPVHIGVATAWTNEITAIVAVGTIGGTPAIEIIDARPGQSWAVDVVADIHRIHRPASITIDPHGPSASLAEHLKERLGDALDLAGVDDLILGTELMLDALSGSPAILIRSDPDFTAELSGAAVRTIGDKGRVISRKTSLGSVARLEAAILAYRKIKAVQKHTPAPIVWSPDNV